MDYTLFYLVNYTK